MTKRLTIPQMSILEQLQENYEIHMIRDEGLYTLVDLMNIDPPKYINPLTVDALREHIILDEEKCTATLAVYVLRIAE